MCPRLRRAISHLAPAFAYKHAIAATSLSIQDFVARLCGIEQWSDDQAHAKLRVTLPLRCTGLGIDVLDKGTDAAVAAMASAVSALRQFRDDIAPIGGWTNDPQAHVDTYSWMTQRIDNATNTAVDGILLCVSLR